MNDIPARQEWMVETGLNPADLAGKIIAIAAYKGGVGKTFLACELSYLLGGILLDLEWDDGSASVSLGYRPDDRQRSILIDAIDKERTPRPVWAGPHEKPGRPALIPGHRDFERRQPSAEAMGNLIADWAKELGGEYGRPLAIDTHPGGSSSTLGAISAAHLVVTPAVLREREMTALEGMLRELEGYSILMVPNMVSASPPGRMLDWLERLEETYDVPSAEPVRHFPWLPTRSLKAVNSSVDHAPTKRAAALVDALHEIAKEVVTRCLQVG